MQAVLDLNSFIIALFKEFLSFDALRASVKIELSLKRELTIGIQDSLQRLQWNPPKTSNLRGTTNLDETAEGYLQ